MNKTVGIVSAAVLCLVSGACQNPVSPSLPIDELLSAPLAIEIAGRQFTLETEIYRDFMPGGSASDSALIAIVYLTAVDGQPFPIDVDGTHIWVVNGNSVWETNFADESRPRSQSHLYQLTKIARGGPFWDVGTEVEVVVRVTALGGSSRLLRATKQVIGSVV